jgi:glycosyltransferase involved in cell wall biosynthesis
VAVRVTQAPAAVTWLLPVKNGGRYLEQALGSIAAQHHRDWRVLAWDNGSSDGSQGVLDAWIPAKLPGRVVLDAPFERLGGCLRRMVEEAESELVARIDADDLNEPERLARQLAFLRSHPAVVAVGSAVTWIDETGRVLGHMRFPESPPEIRWAMFFGNVIAHPTVLARREAILRAGNYRDVSLVEDYDLWLRLVSAGALANLREPLVRYRRHAESVCSRASDRYPPLLGELAREYAPSLFPGVDPGRCLAVWEYCAAEARRPGQAPATSIVWEMLRASARSSGRSPLSLLGRASVGRLLFQTQAAGRRERVIKAAARAAAAGQRALDRARRGAARRWGAAPQDD